jgi:hypothetical protein
VKVANAALLVELDRDGLFMIAEQAGEGGGENLALRQPSSVSLKTLRARERLPSLAQRASWNSCACPVLYQNRPRSLRLVPRSYHFDQLNHGFIECSQAVFI